MQHAQDKKGTRGWNGAQDSRMRRLGLREGGRLMDKARARAKGYTMEAYDELALSLHTSQTYQSPNFPY